MPRMNYELFQFIEKKGGVTVDDIAVKFGMNRRSAATILSRFTNYKRRDGAIKHYLEYEKDTKRIRRLSRYGPKNILQGRYKIGPDWWGELIGAAKELGV